MNDFDDLLGDALSSRAEGTPAASPDAGAAIARARHHRAVRRTVAVSCVGVLALGGVAGLMLRSPSGGSPSVADQPEVGAPAQAACADGQVASAEGDVLLHEGRTYAVPAGQCITATEQAPVFTTCTVTGDLPPATAATVSTGDDGTGCITLAGEPCPAPPLGAGMVTTVPGDPEPAPGEANEPILACAVACGGFSAFPGPAMTADGPVNTAFVDANSDGEFDVTASDAPPNMVVEACASTMPPPPLAGAVTTTSTVPQG